MGREQHWNSVYQTKGDAEVSWFQVEPQVSLELIGRHRQPSDHRIIDVGGGASRLVDHLLQSHWQQVTLLDLSNVALERVRERLGDCPSQRVEWIAGDVVSQSELRPVDFWHDRAVFHFLTAPVDRQKYADLAARTVRPQGHVVLGTFALDGPEKCSGLDVCRYDAAGLARELGSPFRLVEETSHQHETPFGKTQSFCFAVFERVEGAADRP